MIRSSRKEWIARATSVWAILFGAPQVWWAVGIPTGYPGGPARHHMFFASAWRSIISVVVIILCIMTVVIVRTRPRPRERVIRR